MNGLGGARAHSARATAVLAKAAISTLRRTFSLNPGVALIVKAGTTRPAITHSTITISAKAACRVL